MANAVYPKGKENMLSGNINIPTDTIKCILVNTTGTGTLYTYDVAHAALSDVAAGSRIATSPALTSKTVTDGTFDCADFTFSAVTGDVSEGLIYYKDTGTEATSYLLAYKDTGLTGMPVTPNGGDINVTVDAAGVFSL